MIRNLSGKEYEAGLDEAGRGCLAGPVVAAAVIFPSDYCNDKIQDSKLLSPSQRDELRQEIQSNAIAWSIGIKSADYIDQRNILQASFDAMEEAIESLQIVPEYLLIDGNRFKPYPIPFKCEIGGDRRFLAIAAASILAKTYRDELMNILHQEYPIYGWAQNKGYPTLMHRRALQEHGLTPYHRKSYKTVKIIHQKS